MLNELLYSKQENYETSFTCFIITKALEYLLIKMASEHQLELIENHFHISNVSNFHSVKLKYVQIIDLNTFKSI